MAESSNPLPNEFCAVHSCAAAQSGRLRIRIRFKGPATCPDPSAGDGQCSKPTLNARKGFQRKRIADNGTRTSQDAKRVARSAKIPELGNRNRTLLSSTFMISEQEIESRGVSMKLLSGSFKQKQFKADTVCRLMACDTPIKGKKRSRSSLGFPASSRSKRSKRASSKVRRRSTIDDLPDTVLVEILCRLPCSKFVFQCKSVSKRWCTLIADPYLVDRFVNIQRYKRAPKISTLINEKAEEFPPTTSLSSPVLLTPVLERIKSLQGLIEKPIVVATYNDLVLCCETVKYQRHYYICNAYTREWVALPPVPRSCKEVRVGFISNISDYNCEKDDGKGHNVELNVVCGCKVVRILHPDAFEGSRKCDSFKVNVQIFSFETCKWRELVVPSPRHFDFEELDRFSFAYNGTLYWGALYLRVIGLGPFIDNSSTSSSSSSNGDGIIDDKLRLTVFERPLDRCFVPRYLGVCGGCVRMCQFRSASRTLYVWELKDQEHDQMGDETASKLCLSNHTVYSLDPKMYPDNPLHYKAQVFDPNDKDILYLWVDGATIKCNIRTRKFSKTAGMLSVHYYPVLLPWWPTPVPSLPQHAYGGGTCRW